MPVRPVPSSGYAPLSARPSWRRTARALALDGIFAVRLYLAFVLGGWTFLMVLPGDVLAGSTGYRWFATHGTEREWLGFVGGAFVLCASAMFYRRTWWRTFTAATTGAAFGVLAFGAWATNPLSTGTVVYGPCTLLAWWLAFRNATGLPGTSRDGGA